MEDENDYYDNDSDFPNEKNNEKKYIKQSILE